MILKKWHQFFTKIQKLLNYVEGFHMFFLSHFLRYHLFYQFLFLIILNRIIYCMEIIDENHVDTIKDSDYAYNIYEKNGTDLRGVNIINSYYNQAQFIDTNDPSSFKQLQKIALKTMLTDQKENKEVPSLVLSYIKNFDYRSLFLLELKSDSPLELIHTFLDLDQSTQKKHKAHLYTSATIIQLFFHKKISWNLALDDRFYEEVYIKIETYLNDGL